MRLTAIIGLCVAGASACAQQVSPQPANATFDATAGQGDKLRFVVTEGEVHQKLELRERADGAIEVSIGVDKPCTRRASGIATADSEEGDLEIETDMSGEGYPADTFFLEASNGCTIRIRLEALDRAFAWLKEWDCASVCPLSEMPMTRQ